MSLRRSHLAAALLALASVAGPGALTPLSSNGDAEVRAEVVTTLRDDAIDESSGLVVRGDRLFTVNDSGDGPYVYEVDLRTGETVAVTTYADEEPDDVEALAAGRGEALWVGDIGDNRTSRGSIRLHRLVPARAGGRVEAEAFDLTYPDRRSDAEALLVHPRNGQVLVVTKRFGRGGVVYAAPRRLVPGRMHQLERVAAVPGLVTDGTFLAGGSRVLLRTYGSASLYTYPGFRHVATATLPTQEQGEGVAVGEDGRVYLTSEGERSDVLAVDLPRPVPGGASEPPAQERPEPAPRSEYDPQPWMGLGPAGLLLAVLGTGLAAGAVVLGVRAFRRRGRRRQ